MNTGLFIAELAGCFLISAGLFSVIDKVRNFLRIRKLAKIREIPFFAKGGPNNMPLGKLEPYQRDKCFNFVPDCHQKKGDYKVDMDETLLEILPTLEDGDTLMIRGSDVEIIKNPDRFFDVDQFIDQTYEEFKVRNKKKKK